MNLALSRNSPIHCFVCSNAFEIHDGLIFDLYTGLPHTYVLWSEAQTLSKTKSDENRWNWGRWNRSRSYQHLHVHCSEAQVKHVPSDTSQVHCSKPKVIYIFLLLLWDLDISMAPHSCNCNVTWCTTIVYLLFKLSDERQSGCLHLFNICHEKVWQAPRQGGDIPWTTISSSNWGWGIQLLSSLLRSIHKHIIQYM